MDVWEAAEQGDVERVRALVEQDAGVVHAIWWQYGGRTLLLVAALRGHSGVVRYLLDAGAAINYRDKFGLMALHEACMRGHAGVASVLLHRSADVTALTPDGLTALLLAAINGCDAVVRVLLEHGGSDVDALTTYRKTALHRACMQGHAGVVTQLLEAGADPTLRGADGRTAVDLAASYGRHTCVRILQEWDRAYLLQRARRLRDAASTL